VSLFTSSECFEKAVALRVFARDCSDPDISSLANLLADEWFKQAAYEDGQQAGGTAPAKQSDQRLAA
jgi:hypothetical protein